MEHFKFRDDRVGEIGNGLFGKFMSLITFDFSVQLLQFCGASFFYQGDRNCILSVQWNILRKNVFLKSFNITSSTWYIEKENVDLLMNNFGHVSQNSFFSSPMKFLSENSTYRKIVVFTDFRRRAKNFFL